jgi:hypothetical protein
VNTDPTVNDSDEAAVWGYALTDDEPAALRPWRNGK